MSTAALYRTPAEPGVSVSALWSAAFCTLIALLFVALSDGVGHWFVIPVTVCGVIIGVDAVDWLRGRVDLFDPVGIIGLVGLHFFFVAPLYQIYAGWHMPYVDEPPDWRPWLGLMASVNVVGLVCYRLGRQFGRRVALGRRERKPAVWEINTPRFTLWVVFALVATAALQIMIYQRLGGIAGYVLSYTEGSDALVGMGWLLGLAESFPILMMFGFVVLARRQPAARTWLAILAVVVLFFVLKMLFGGLRGSRSNTVWGLFWAVGLVHLWIRPLTRQFALGGLVFIFLFTYAYGFYKAAGTDAVHVFDGAEARAELEDKTGRSADYVLLGDLARSDVQACLISRLYGLENDYTFAGGGTYLGSAALLIPRSFWPDRPPGKVKAGTEAMYGTAAYQAGRSSSRQYGLAGEAILNFGVLGVPVAFFLFGVVLALIHRKTRTLDTRDVRTLLLPFLVNLGFVMLIADSDNLIFWTFKNGMLPVAVLALSSGRLRRPRVASAGALVRRPGAPRLALQP